MAKSGKTKRKIKNKAEAKARVAELERKLKKTRRKLHAEAAAFDVQQTVQLRGAIAAGPT